MECNTLPLEIDIDHELVEGLPTKDERQRLPYRGSHFSEINHAGRHALQLEISKLDLKIRGELHDSLTARAPHRQRSARPDGHRLGKTTVDDGDAGAAVQQQFDRVPIDLRRNENFVAEELEIDPTGGSLTRCETPDFFLGRPREKSLHRRDIDLNFR